MLKRVFLFLTLIFQVILTTSAAGNTVCRTTVGEGDSVEYGYHHGRLLWSRHSRSPWNDARYLYGAPAQQDFSAGRVVMKRDATGITRYGYDISDEDTMELNAIFEVGQFYERDYYQCYHHLVEILPTPPQIYKHMRRRLYQLGEEQDYK